MSERIKQKSLKVEEPVSGRSSRVTDKLKMAEGVKRFSRSIRVGAEKPVKIVKLSSEKARQSVRSSGEKSARSSGEKSARPSGEKVQRRVGASDMNRRNLVRRKRLEKLMASLPPEKLPKPYVKKVPKLIESVERFMDVHRTKAEWRDWVKKNSRTVVIHGKREHENTLLDRTMYRFGDHVKRTSYRTDRELAVRTWEEYLHIAKKSYIMKLENPNLKDVSKDDFLFVKTIGIGAFGKVMLVQYLPTKKYYAAKLMKKAELMRDRHAQHAHNEKKVLQCIRFPFTIHLEFFFQDNVYLFYILPYMSGGELFAYLNKVNYVREEPAKFYAGQILLALEYLHYLGLVFRDLKPENVLFDVHGYVKLADFGFCKPIETRTYTFCGTAEYLAPEMLVSKGYGRAVDWWTFGVFIFEMCAGYTPFYSRIATRTYNNIIKSKYKMPYYFSAELKDLVKNLLQVDLSLRYGNLKNGVADIKQHKWFNQIAWMVLLNKQLKAPYLPLVIRPDDTSHFDPQKEKPLTQQSIDRYEREFANF